MQIITTAAGRDIPADIVVLADQYDVLQINTSALTILEAATVFSSPEETRRLTVLDGEGVRVYDNYTDLRSVQESRMVPGALLIRLKRGRAN